MDWLSSTAGSGVASRAALASAALIGTSPLRAGFVCWRQSVVWGGRHPTRQAGCAGQGRAARDKPTETRTHLAPASVAPLQPHDVRVPCLLQLPQCCITPGPTIVTHLQQWQSDKVL